MCRINQFNLLVMVRMYQRCGLKTLDNRFSLDAFGIFLSLPDRSKPLNFGLLTKKPTFDPIATVDS
jgi:hypothetical protein